MFNMFFMFVFLRPFGNSAENLKHMKMNRRRSIKQYSEEVRLPGSLPMEVGVKCDIVGMRIRDGPSPPRVPSEY